MSGRSLSEFQYDIGARLARGDVSGASHAAADCRAAWPDDPAGWLLGSITELVAGNAKVALGLADAGIAVRPHDLQSHLQRAECLLQLGERGAALDAANDAAVSAQGIAAALDAVGEFLVHAAAHERALQIYDEALKAAPLDVALLARRAVIQRFLGNFAAATRDLESILRLSPADPEAIKGLAELRRQSAEHNSVGAAEAALAAVPADSTDAATLHFGLAKSYEDLGDYVASWRHLRAGNRIERAALQYDSAHDARVIERIIESFRGIEAVQPDSTGEAPIFIVGLPRTGTTLVERIIGGHSQVHAAGELPALSEAIGAAVERMGAPRQGGWLTYAAALGGLDGPSVAREYLARAHARRGDRARFADKQPVNFFYCAPILRAFPQARIVHLTRHPLAACYAIFKTRFGRAYPFSYDLTELAEFYIGYRRLMAHWHQVLPGRILDVAYEDVVTALEPTTARLLEYLGLPFESACLEFHLNPAATTTASAVQVRQPLYDSSLQQWRHYSDELASLRAHLEGAGIPVE